MTGTQVFWLIAIGMFFVLVAVVTAIEAKKQKKF